MLALVKKYAHIFENLKNFLLFLYINWHLWHIYTDCLSHNTKELKWKYLNCHKNHQKRAKRSNIIKAPKGMPCIIKKKQSYTHVYSI